MSKGSDVIDFFLVFWFRFEEKSVPAMVTGGPFGDGELIIFLLVRKTSFMMCHLFQKYLTSTRLNFMLGIITTRESSTKAQSTH